MGDNSLFCDESGECHERWTTIIKLKERNDDLAKEIANEHGLVLRGEGRPLPGTSEYFANYVLSGVSHDQRQSTLAEIRKNSNIESVHEEQEKMRKKRI